MKTTIELPDALAEEARQLARSSGTTLRELVVSGLRDELVRRREVPRADFCFPTVGGRGLAEDVAPDDAIVFSYGPAR